MYLAQVIQTDPIVVTEQDRNGEILLVAINKERMLLQRRTSRVQMQLQRPHRAVPQQMAV